MQQLFKDQLPDNVVDYLHRKLKFFQENECDNIQDGHRVNVDKYDRLLRTGTIQVCKIGNFFAYYLCLRTFYTGFFGFSADGHR